MILRVTKKTTGWNVGDLIEADEKRAKQLLSLEEAVLVEGEFTPEPVKEEVPEKKEVVHQGGKHVNKN